jgi:hypothetical protein
MHARLIHDDLSDPAKLFGDLHVYLLSSTWNQAALHVRTSHNDLNYLFSLYSIAG